MYNVFLTHALCGERSSDGNLSKFAGVNSRANDSLVQDLMTNELFFSALTRLIEFHLITLTN